MRRELPPRPHIDHLKKQAKDLLDGHERRDPDALDRIVDALPSFAGRSHEQTAAATFALHDAQSAIAREHGFVSWNELREEVERRSANEVAAKANSRAILDSVGKHLAIPFPEAVLKALGTARADRTPAIEALQHALPERLPLLAPRNVLLLPGAIAPLHVARAQSLAAVELALHHVPSTMALFAQIAEGDELIREQGLHRHGCEALIRSHVRAADGSSFVVLEMLRPIELRAIEPSAGLAAAPLAWISAFAVDAGDAGGEVAGLADTLRELAGRLVGSLPEPEVALRMLAALEPAQLADAVVQNLFCTVAETARYAAEPRLIERLRIAIALTRARADATAAG